MNYSIPEPLVKKWLNLTKHGMNQSREPRNEAALLGKKSRLGNRVKM